MSTCSPPAIAGHARAWAGVGPSKARSNQSRTVGVKAESGDGGTSLEGTPARGAHVFGLPHSAGRALRAAEGAVGGVPARGAGARVRLQARPLVERAGEHVEQALEWREVAGARGRERVLDLVVARDVDRVDAVHGRGDRLR